MQPRQKPLNSLLEGNGVQVNASKTYKTLAVFSSFKTCPWVRTWPHAVDRSATANPERRSSSVAGAEQARQSRGRDTSSPQINNEDRGNTHGPGNNAMYKPHPATTHAGVENTHRNPGVLAGAAATPRENGDGRPEWRDAWEGEKL